MSQKNKINATQNEAALSYRKMRGLYFLAAIFLQLYSSFLLLFHFTLEGPKNLRASAKNGAPDSSISGPSCVFQAIKNYKISRENKRLKSQIQINEKCVIQDVYFKWNHRTLWYYNRKYNTSHIIVCCV